MDPIILDFAAGIMIGAASELLFLKRSGRKTKTKQRIFRTSARRPVATGRPSSSIDHLRIGRGTIAAPLAQLERQLEQPVKTAHNIVNSTGPMLLSCPACGLKAPETLMAEHLLGSPLHQRRSPVAPSPPPSKNTRVNSRNASSFEEESRESVRNLLQMLVPPRAFGRRHAQRTVDPLAQLVQTPD